MPLPATLLKLNWMTDVCPGHKPAALCGWLFMAVLLTWAAPAVADDIDQNEALRLMEQGRIQALPDLIEDALTRFPGRFLEAELEREDGRYVYELEIVTQDRRVVELEYDAVTGTLLDVDIDEDD